MINRINKFEDIANLRAQNLHLILIEKIVMEPLYIIIPTWIYIFNTLFHASVGHGNVNPEYQWKHQQCKPRMATSELISVHSFASINDNDHQNLHKMFSYFVHRTWPKGDHSY